MPADRFALRRRKPMPYGVHAMRERLSERAETLMLNQQTERSWQPRGLSAVFPPWYPNLRRQR